MDGPSDPAAARYRCTQCGNLTRFDVTSTRRTRAFHHFTVGGELDVEDEVVLSEVVEEVSCRWCGSGAAVERRDDGVVADADLDGSPTSPGAPSA